MTSLPAPSSEGSLEVCQEGKGDTILLKREEDGTCLLILTAVMQHLYF